MRVVGEEYTRRNTKLYRFTIRDAEGQDHLIEAFGIDTITDVERVPDLSSLKHLSPGVPDEVFRTPVGPVDLLIGSNYRALQPRSAKEIRHLRMVTSKFGVRMILTGTDPLLGAGGHSQTYLARMMKTAVPVAPTGVKVLHIKNKFPSFFEAEELGAAPQPHCEDCSKRLKSCKDCSYRGQLLTRDQREVVRKVEATMRLDREEGRIHVQYPLKPEAYLQTDNSSQARAMQSNIEKRLIRDQLMDDYDTEMQKALQAGSVVKLAEEELKTWTGPVHYLCHFPVLKPGSVTTKVRIVANSKMKNNNTGLSLNDVVEAGPNALNSLLDVLILWRSVEVGLLFDLTKAYQQLVTGPVERHLRRFLYRKSPDEAWETYAYDRVTFGDVIAALCLELAKALVAKHGEQIDRLACALFLAATYCDDHCGGGSKAEVERMRGEQMPGGGTTGTMSRILMQGGFKANFMVRTKNCTMEEKLALGGTVLGLGYDVFSDQLEFQVTLTMVVQGKKRKKRTVTFTRQDIQKLRTQDRTLTKRMVLSMVMGQYDPLGLICALMIRAKILLRRLYGPQSNQIDWDDPLPKEELTAWADFMMDMVDMKPIKFSRSTKPENSVGRPWLIGFHDGSLSAFCMVVYILWTLKTEVRVDQPPGKQKKKATLMIAKSRVTPINGTITVPRAEIQSLTMLTRGLTLVARTMSDKPERVIICGDSECSIAALEKTGGVLGPYFTNRVSEIQENIRQLAELSEIVEPVQHIAGELNPADLGTRGHATIADVSEDSVWQNGPKFLTELDREDWPISRQFRDYLPQAELRSRHEVTKRVNSAQIVIGKSMETLQKLVEVSFQSDSWVKSQGVLSRLLRAFCHKGPHQRKQILSIPEPKDLHAARQAQFLVSMGTTFKAMQNGKLKSLNYAVKNGIVIMSGRFRQKDLAKLLGKEGLPVLMPETRLARVIMTSCHNEDHRRSAADTLARSRNHAWIPQGTRLAKAVIKSCMRCRLSAKKRVDQIMGRLPEDILEVSPPFTCTALDLFGPYCCRGMEGGARKTMLVWGVIFACIRTKAVCILACTGYDTESFLSTFNRFSSIYGEPAIIISDQGSQLCAAAKLSEREINWDSIRALQLKQGRDGSSQSEAVPGEMGWQREQLDSPRPRSSTS